MLPRKEVTNRLSVAFVSYVVVQRFNDTRNLS